MACTALLLGLLTNPLYEADAASKPLKATTKRINGEIALVGKTARSIPQGAKITVFDAGSNTIVYSGSTDSKRAFNIKLSGSSTTPCLLRMEVTNPGDNTVTRALVKVTGAPASCAVPEMGIASPSQDLEIVAGQTVDFTAGSISVGKKSKKTAAAAAAATYAWSFGDGSQDGSGTSASHTYTIPGRYKVTLSGWLDEQSVKDALVVSVIPPTGSNPYPKVAEQPAPQPASGMPGADGSNDTDAYVVMPFEDTGMQGGSQVTLPFNSLNPYNALNAQVLKKVPRKPIIVSSDQVGVFYSAASNPLDPLGANSINSTSQNLFADQTAGANFDPDTTLCVWSCLPTYNSDGSLKTAGKETKLIAGHDYQDAVLAKSEFWDRSYQPWDKQTGAANPVQYGQAGIDGHNRVTFNGVQAMTKPDQGIAGHVDGGTGKRAMPGIADPYKRNDPQTFDYSSDQSAFVAQNIPASDIDDQGRVNPYPLMRVEAKVGGQRVAAADAVYTTASETRCRECHSKGQMAADDQVWRTPVHESELRNADGSPGPATGNGSFLEGQTPATIPSLSGDLFADFTKYGYGPAIHNRFDDQHVALTDKIDNRPPNVGKNYDANGLRTDRVVESRYWNLTANAACTKGQTDCKLQLRLKFKAAEDYGDKDDWKAQEKAALFNAALMHDYMTKYYYNQAYGELNLYGNAYPALDPAAARTTYATTFADQAEEKGKGSLGAACAGHHTSQLKADIGAGAQAYQNGLSNFSGTMHAFHGKLQVYKDGENKGRLIRDERGHPLMFGGRGWDSMHFDEANIRQKAAGTVNADGSLVDPSKETRNLWDTLKNNWAPDRFPMHPQGRLLYPFGEQVAMDENCSNCHTGKTEHGYRDIHHAAGLKCDNCHGDMLAVGNSYPNEQYNYALTAGSLKLGDDDPDTLTQLDFRRYWIDEPDCGSCHMGDAKSGDFSPGVMKTAWNAADPAKASRIPMNARFAVMPHEEERPEKATATQTEVDLGLAAKVGDTFYRKVKLSQALYRKSGDVHGSGSGGDLNCSTCHGGSHATWPNPEPNANDNLTAIQLQGYEGKIMECSVCHVKDDFVTGLVATDGGDASHEFPNGAGVAQGIRAGNVVTPASSRAYLAGPHGMHPVNDASWYKHAEGAAASAKPKKINGGWHNDMAKKPGPDGEDQCAACHGADHKGTRLSKTQVERTLTNDKGKPVKVAKDQIIGCDLCHNLKKSFIGAPDPKSPTGGWPAAKDHAPRLPEPFDSNPDETEGHS
ncbi:PKD domain-containing protein [Methylomonas sp. HYX-M1]|uniref:PKD domain-containing protein n=1 Tax=Methylomonas sp. HYX-M1 TaxID=3139307 RepID=UPI00345BB522